MAYDYKSDQLKAEQLQRAVLRILESHVGAQNAIKARDIAKILGEGTGRYSDRRVRIAVAQLRKDGHLILSSVGSPAGYYLAASREEWEDFRHSNLRPRALDILETDRAMAQAARDQFGQTVQLRMDGLDAVQLSR